MVHRRLRDAFSARSSAAVRVDNAKFIRMTLIAKHAMRTPALHYEQADILHGPEEEILPLLMKVDTQHFSPNEKFLPQP